MKRKILALAFFATLLFGCASNIERSNQATPTENTNIEMGVILPRFENQILAQQIKRAMIFSAEEFNSSQKNTSSKINLTFLEIDNSKEEFLTAIKVLKTRKVKIVHAGFTNQCAFELKKFEELDALVNFFSQYPPIATQTKNAVRIFLNGAQVCEEMVKEINPAKPSDKKSAIILTEDSTLGKSCREYLKFQTSNLNLKIFTESFSENEKNFELLAKNMSPSKIDYALIFTSDKKLELILSSLSKANYKGKIYANCTLLNNKIYDFKNLNFKRVKSEFELEKANVKNSTNSKSFGTSLASTLAYDAVKITATAFLNSSKNKDDIKSELTGKTFEGASGKIRFDSYGDTSLPLKLTNE